MQFFYDFHIKKIRELILTDIIGKKIDISGVVQGVGFRPFVFQLSDKYNLKGEVFNTSAGVTIYIEGLQKKIELFCYDLSEKKPPLAYITNISIKTKTVKGYKKFTIVKSGKAEYDNPLDRRFHAQPNGCDKCGPHLSLFTNNKKPVSVKEFPEQDSFGKSFLIKDLIEITSKLLKNGKIVAIKGLGGFHLVVDAGNNSAVKLLRERKKREKKPLALMACNIETIKKFAVVSKEEEILLTSHQRPIVILKKKENSHLSPQIAPDNRYVGVMLPYTPLHYLLLENYPHTLVMTSGNKSNEPISIDNEDAFNEFSHIADYFLINNRDIYLRTDDSVVLHRAGNTRFFRRSRGFVPMPLFLKQKVPSILGCGALLKNTICLTKENNAFLSQHIGNLENLPTYNFFKLTIAHLKRILNIDPEIIAHDLHPEYMSSIYAGKIKGKRKIAVQHHHAHIVSCMAENKIDGYVIGVALDGTGYGTDGAIWGGEILIANLKSFKRAAHLSYTPMPGSNAAVQEPWRMAVSHLYKTFGDDFINLDIPFLKTVEKKDINFIVQMIKKEINSPVTSSMGRFFDAVSVIVGAGDQRKNIKLRNKISFEGQAAIELEMIAKPDGKQYSDLYKDSNNIYQSEYFQTTCNDELAMIGYFKRSFSFYYQF